MDDSFIGLDAHKENVVATVLDAGGAVRDQAEFPARATDIQAYLARWSGRRHVVLEACNVWEHVYDAAAAVGGVLAAGLYVVGPRLSLAALVLIAFAWREREFQDALTP